MATSALNPSFLPVPDIQDDIIVQHCHKQANKQKRDDSQLLKPPKLKPRYHDSNFNRSQSSTSAHAISFREFAGNTTSGIDETLLSSVYNRSSEESYFEQCFTRISKIGEGSFGEVFKVRSKEDGLLYAVKKSKQLFRSENYRQERLEEVKRYEQFSHHENCVRLYKAWEQDDRLYMQMELCQESLEHYLEKKKHIPEEKIWSILLDLLLAVKSLHDKNLIHLDIKLDNVLIGDDGICKLADFGLVIDIDRANRHQATEGDSRYIAPELMQGHFSKAADIFSLGIAILELCCFLELPPNGPLWQELRSGILPEDFIKSISGDMQMMIKSMMTPDHFARPTVDDLLGHTKLVVLLQRRRRWEVVKKFKQTYRWSRRVIWSKLCNFKNIVCKFFSCILTSLKLHDPTHMHTNAENKEALSPVNNMAASRMNAAPVTIEVNTVGVQQSTDNYHNICYHGTPTNFSIHKIENYSTPLNRNHQSFRLRKDFSFNVDTEEIPRDISNNFLSEDDCDIRSSSFVRNPLETSSFRRKNLFPKNDEFDSD